MLAKCFYKVKHRFTYTCAILTVFVKVLYTTANALRKPFSLLLYRQGRLGDYTPSPTMTEGDLILPDTEANRLLPSERQQRIRQLAVQQGVLRIPELAETFSVSEMTIRRDLELLEDSGHLERTFGGAITKEQTSFESTYSIRLHTHTPQKEAIATYASSLIEEGDTVALDASTTCLALAKQLANRTITVITNGLDVAEALRHSNVKVILIGGYLRQVAGSFAGPLALSGLEGLHVDHFFVSGKGFVISAGLMDSDLDEVEVKRGMVAAATHVTALIDSSKFGVHALGRITPTNGIHLVITDSGIDDTTKTQLQKRKLKVKVVKV
jgi:DeoR/GlpR family transcriptional regulator of sugar metabolism